MDLHLSRDYLLEVLSAGGVPSELDAALAHLSECRTCQELAVGVIEELRKGSAIGPLPDAWLAQLEVLDDKVRQELDRLRGRGWWAELKNHAPEEQREQIRSVLSLQAPRTFAAAISEASLLAASDPHLGGETALTARLIAEILPSDRYPDKMKSDLQGEAMSEFGNCRRLAADWPGSKAALQEAASFLERGTGDPRRKGRLLSVSASLASDTGNPEAALRLVRQAAECYRKSRDSEGLASVRVKQASTLLAGCRFEAAMDCAEQALGVLSPKSIRLEMLARSIVTECLIELQRPAQALLSFATSRSLYEQLWVRRTQLKVGYLEARLLDAFGRAREAEKAFREVTNGYVDEGLYKDALLTALTFFEGVYKRGDLEKAARLCEETSKLLNTPLCHPQIQQVWEELLVQIRSQVLTVAKILEVRLYVNRHWNIPAAQLPPHHPQAAVADIGPLALANHQVAQGKPVLQTQPTPAALKKFETGHTIEVPTDPAQLANGGYQKVRDSVERKMIDAALQHTRGHLGEAAQLLGLSRNGLEAKAERLGLKALLTYGRWSKAKRSRPRSKP